MIKNQITIYQSFFTVDGYLWKLPNKKVIVFDREIGNDAKNQYKNEVASVI
jgi:hypothetical protein